MNNSNEIVEQIITLEEFSPHPRNYNKHPNAQLEMIAASLEKFGQVRNIVVWRNFFVAGHGVAQAAMESGRVTLRANAIPDNWPEERVLAYLAADNELGKLSEPDNVQLLAILDEVKMYDDALIQAIGYDSERMDNLIREVALVTDPQDNTNVTEPEMTRAEEMREKWQVSVGQLWQLGRHRLVCGDCLSEEVIQRVVGELVPTIVIADPPYGVSIVAANVSVGGGEAYDIPFGGVKNAVDHRRMGYVGGGQRQKDLTGRYPIEDWKKGKTAKRLGSIGGAKPFGSAGDQDSDRVRGSVGASNAVAVGKYAPIIGDETIETAVKSSSLYLDLFPDASHFWWGANYYATYLDPSPCWIVWNKETTGNFADCELAWSNLDKAARIFTHRWNGMLRDSERDKRWHPTQKPAALASWLCEEFGKEGDVVVDPFAGAGWTILACEQINRTGIGLELSPDYVAVILERWHQLTGQSPKLLE